MATRTWAGFSEEELKLLKNDLVVVDNGAINAKNIPTKSENIEEKLKSEIKVIKSFDKTGRKRNAARHDLRKTKKTEPSLINLEVQAPEDECLSKLSTQNQPVNSKTATLERSNSAGNTVLRVDSETLTYEIMPLQDKKTSISNNDSMNNVQTENDVISPGVERIIVNEKNSTSVSISDLNSFEQRQKHLEAANAKTRELLLQAIDDRKKRTEEEGKKIRKVQVELGKLDTMLSNDVGILRKEIEMASLDFFEAQKRYDKAEKEFVESKLLLFQKMERKEKLTEHLCTIIEQNEARKARKLGELMHELDLGELYEECRANGMNMVLPQFCALNNVTYNTMCNTIKPTHTALDVISIIPHEKSNENSKKPTQEQLPPPDEV